MRKTFKLISIQLKNKIWRVLYLMIEINYSNITRINLLKTFFLVFILVNTLGFLKINQVYLSEVFTSKEQESTPFNNKNLQQISINERLAVNTSIIIENDTALEYFSSFGEGSIENPYLIEKKVINSPNSHGITITNTTKYFVIKECNIMTDKGSTSDKRFGIYIQDVTAGTANITSNSLLINSIGIYIDNSSFTVVNNNLCFNNSQGIFIENSEYTMVSNNNCSYHLGNAITLHDSRFSTVVNNTCNNANVFGINLENCHYSTVANNTCNHNSYIGINLHNSFNCEVVNNICSGSNSRYYGNGIRLSYYSNYCNISWNSISLNQKYGIYLEDTNHTNIHHNTLIDNVQFSIYYHSQACDNGTDNTWYDPIKKEGNFWSDYSGNGTYAIEGEARSEDLYPLLIPNIANTTDDSSKDTNSKGENSIGFSQIITIFTLVYICLLPKISIKRK